jgi:hypothetical protein
MDPKSEFRNTTGGYIGVQAKKPDGSGFNGIAVRPDGNIWLDEEEQIATANAPRADENNPFENGDLELVTAAKEIANRRRIGDTEKPQVTGASDAAQPPPSELPTPDPETPPVAPEEDVEATKAAKEKAAREEEAKAKQKERAEAEESARQAAARGRARQAPQETGAAKAPTGSPPAGSRAAGEEVGTPEAAKKA